MEATLECLATLGPRATSVRAICSAAGVSPGLLRHYYEGKEDLIASSYEFLTDKLSIQFEEIITSNAPARERLKNAFQVLLNGDWVSPEILGAWLGFWSLQQNDQRMKDHHKRANIEVRSGFFKMLKAYSDEENLALTDKTLKFAAYEISGLGDGLWLELCLDSETFNGDQAVDICMDWLEGFRRRNLNT